MMDESLLEVENLSVSFGSVRAAQNVSFTLRAGRTLCLVGERGSGKSVTTLALLGLLPKTARITADKLALNEQSLLGRSEKEMALIRGKEISMIFQDPYTSLDPRMNARQLIQEPLGNFNMAAERDAGRPPQL
jgi:peptide/nickel transport system ATP-binding protein